MFNVSFFSLNPKSNMKEVIKKSVVKYKLKVGKINDCYYYTIVI